MRSRVIHDAIERAEGYAIPHGEAVAIVMMFAAAARRLGGRLDERTGPTHGAGPGAGGLPTSSPGGPSPGPWGTHGPEQNNPRPRLRLGVL